jgi:hypothetical protein
VEAVDEGDVEEILIIHDTKPKLRDGVWWLTIGFAGKQAATVTRLACPGAIAVE